MSAMPDHVVTASNPPELAGDVAGEVERLRSATVEVAFMLCEGDWRGAARTAYRAAWHFHRLPRAEQEAYVVSDLHDDDGPVPFTDDWSSSAFVAWLIYRCNRSIEGTRRTERPEFDELGRKLTAAERAAREKASTVNERVTDAPETPDLSQAALFDVPSVRRGVAGEL